MGVRTSGAIALGRARAAEADTRRRHAICGARVGGLNPSGRHFALGMLVVSSFEGVRNTPLPYAC